MIRAALVDEHDIALGVHARSDGGGRADESRPPGPPSRYTIGSAAGVAESARTVATAMRTVGPSGSLRVSEL